MTLARLLTNHIVVRGKGFTIQQRLSSADLTNLHTEAIDYAAGKAAELDQQGKTGARNKVLTMFKGLVLATIGMTGKEAAAIHFHMVRSLKARHLEPSDSRHWDGHAAYEKKLVNLMSKDGSKHIFDGLSECARLTPVFAAIRAAAQKQNKGTDDANGEADAEVDDEHAEALAVAAAARKQVRARPAAKKRKALAESQSQGGSQETDRLPARRSKRVSETAVPDTYADANTSDIEED